MENFVRYCNPIQILDLGLDSSRTLHSVLERIPIPRGSKGDMTKTDTYPSSPNSVSLAATEQENRCPGVIFKSQDFTRSETAFWIRRRGIYFLRRRQLRLRALKSLNMKLMPGLEVICRGGLSRLTPTWRITTSRTKRRN